MIQVTTALRIVLVADDEPLTLRAIQAVLTDHGFTVRSARDGTEGRALVDNIAEECPEMLITDFDMPGCCGEELADYARQRCHGIKIIYTSGLPHPELRKTIADDPLSRFLEKPFMRAGLLATMHTLGVD